MVNGGGWVAIAAGGSAAEEGRQGRRLHHGALGVSLSQYALFMFLAILNPLICMFYIWTGIGIVHITPEQKEQKIFL